MAHKFEIPIERKPWHGVTFPLNEETLKVIQQRWPTFGIRQVCSNRRLPWYTRFNFWCQEKLGRLLRKWSDKLMGEPIED
jgi:hypothetical protein